MSFNEAPTFFKLLLILLSTSHVWTSMFKCLVPISSMISTPAMVLSGLRELVPETNIKSPALLTCG